MKDNTKRDGPFVTVLGKGRMEVGPGVFPATVDGQPVGLVPAIVISRLVEHKLLFGLDGKPLPQTKDPANIVAVIGTANRQAVQVVLRTCMELLSMFDEQEKRQAARAAAVGQVKPADAPPPTPGAGMDGPPAPDEKVPQ